MVRLVRNLVLQERVEQSEKWLNLLLRWMLLLIEIMRKRLNYLALQVTTALNGRLFVRILIDQSQVSDYQWHQSPTRSALFNAGETSRINVANALCRLVLDDDLWQQWHGQMPVIYNA